MDVVLKTLKWILLFLYLLILFFFFFLWWVLLCVVVDWGHLCLHTMTFSFYHKVVIISILIAMFICRLDNFVCIWQELHVSVDTEGAMESVEGSLFEDALLALTSLFWTWLLWRRATMICQVSLMLKSQGWGVQREHQKFESCSTCPRMMMWESM